MQKYIAKAYLSNNGKIVKPEDEIELSNEQALRLGDKVVAVEGENAPQSLADLTNEELKGIAESKGLEGYAHLNKSGLVSLIEGTEQE